jgi:hypothetical protein
MLDGIVCKLAFMTFGDRLDSALSLAQVDRAVLAEELGISVQAVGQVISGKTKAMTAGNCAMAARLLKVGRRRGARQSRGMGVHA